MKTSSSIYLAWRDWCHEFNLSLCAVLALASMLTPLLILHGVHFGVITGLKTRLLQDPKILTIIPETTPPKGFAIEFLEEVRKLPGSQFCIARTRDIAAEIQLIAHQNIFLSVALEPTAPGDPIMIMAGSSIPDEPLSPPSPSYTPTFEAVLSATTAKKLNIGPTDIVQAKLSRRLRNGKLESIEMAIRVINILPPAAIGTDCIFMRLPVLQAIQDFRDGFAVPLLAKDGDAPPSAIERFYESFRLHAKTLDDVETLYEWFANQGYIMRTKVREIASIRNLDTSLSIVVAVIAVTAGAGFAAFMFSSMHATVRRKKKMLGMLRILGFPSSSLLLYPTTHALLTACFGTVLALSLYSLIAYGIDTWFVLQSGGTPICHMPSWHFPVTLFAVAGISALASLQAAVRAAHIEPSSVIREF